MLPATASVLPPMQSGPTLRPELGRLGCRGRPRIRRHVVAPAPVALEPCRRGLVLALDLVGDRRLAGQPQDLVVPGSDPPVVLVHDEGGQGRLVTEVVRLGDHLEQVADPVPQRRARVQPGPALHLLGEVAVCDDGVVAAGGLDQVSYACLTQYFLPTVGLTNRSSLPVSLIPIVLVSLRQDTGRPPPMCYWSVRSWHQHADCSDQRSSLRAPQRQ